MSTAGLIAYWLVGFIITVAIHRRKGPVSIADVAYSALVAIAWPITVVCLLLWTAFKEDSWFNRKRW